ncbi:MAG: septum site-determining protein MinD [Anaerolinea sp.]|nr:septum site-determining protein MinD [Anaerolinea sp.]MCC6975508.1 septum site-determining protein MinD [Anaerolineae bacterium]CAG1011752.1 Septum site-determining protein MinD [Anaerolineae bacterium]
MGAKVVTVTSGKGGVGKTTVTANLSAALVSLEKRVACIDADIGLRNLDLILGVENRIKYHLVDVVEGRCKLQDAIVKHKQFPNLSIIPAAQDRDKSAISPTQMVAIVNDLSPHYDYIIIDSPAGIERGFRNAVAPAQEVLIVTNPEVSAVRDADRVIGLLEAANPRPPARLIINRVKAEMIKRGDMLTPDDVFDMLSIPLIGIIPEDEAVLVAGNRGMPDLGSRAGHAFKTIARRLMGEEIPLKDAPTPGLFRRLTRLFGGRT